MCILVSMQISQLVERWVIIHGDLFTPKYDCGLGIMAGFVAQFQTNQSINQSFSFAADNVVHAFVARLFDEKIHQLYASVSLWKINKL